MEKVFNEVNSLDKKCYEQFSLTEDILMEHAATSMLNFIENKKTKFKILIACGSGNNGADGIALARLLQGKYKVTILLPFGTKSPMASTQLIRAKQLNVETIQELPKDLKNYTLIVDCLFGSGLSRELNTKTQNIIYELNQLKAYKLACDIPSGIGQNGEILPICFDAHTTITMGALKKSLFSDEAKNFVGKIKVANLGVQRDLYEGTTNCFLLNKKDLKLPIRDSKNSHKGSFGQLSIVIGEKKGAGLLSCEAAFSFGCGLITAISKDKIKKIDNFIMQDKKIPSKTTAIAIGMGLGDNIDKSYIENNLPKVIDADIFYDEKAIKTLLEQKNIVLTPHPKEFCSLLKICNIADITVCELQNNRFKYVELFNSNYPETVLLLKGSNVLIAYQEKTYINRFGTVALSKGGSGDVLSGLIGSLLAQGYNSIDATINGSLAHTLAAQKYTKNNYSLIPNDIIENVKKL